MTIVDELIDWKFINFLKDRATTLEDEGHEISISAGISGNGFNTPIYVYENRKDRVMNFYLSDYELMRQQLNSGGKFRYMIVCKESYKEFKGDHIICDRYYEKIKSKCTRKGFSYGAFIVEPI